LLGNGFGGSLALGYALAYPETLSKLVICDAAAGFPEQGKQAFRVMAEKVASGGLGAIAEIAANRVFHPAYLAAHPTAIDERREALMLIHPDAIQAACSLLVEADLIPQCRDLKLLTLVICGELDAATPPVLNRAIAEAIPHARYIELPKMQGVLLIAVLLRFMDSFMIYTEPFVVTGGGPGNATTFLSIDLVKMAIGQFDLGPAAAFSIMYFLVILPLLGRLERPLPLPESIARPILRGGGPLPAGAMAKPMEKA
jgi:hypothetical protein